MRYFEMSVGESYTSSTSVIQVETQPSGRNSPSKDECIRYDACARKLLDTHSRKRGENISEGALQRRLITKPLLRHMTGMLVTNFFSASIEFFIGLTDIRKGSHLQYERDLPFITKFPTPSLCKSVRYMGLKVICCRATSRL